MSTPKELAGDKLRTSGLSDEDRRLLHIDVLTAEQTKEHGFLKLPSLKLNYLTPLGKPMVDWPGHPPFWRLRYLAAPNDASIVTGEKPPRYVQPKDSLPCVYFPANQDWKAALAKDAPLIITEGELKAACACKNGFATLGLGGVNSWRALRKGVTLLPDLERIDWVNRHTYLCFDSDYRTNPKICAALHEIGDQLQDRGAFVYLISIPALVEGEKTGLDDYLVAEGAGAFAELLHVAIPLGLTRPLFEFNKAYMYIRDPGLIVSMHNGSKIAPDAFKSHLEAAKSYQERVIKPNGELSFKSVSAAGHWLSWPLRAQVDGMTYAPGQPKLMFDPPRLNTWPGWGCEPKKGDVSLFLKLIDHIFTDAEPEAKKWFLQWCAYPLQHPGTKLFSSCLLHGIKHGTGKSLVGYTLGKIYGRNFSEINQGHLYAPFNEWAENKQFVLADDISGAKKREDAELLKKLITQKELRVNIKYLPSYCIPDWINYLFTSNHPDAFFLEDDDRRFMVHEITVDPMPMDFYNKYDAWLNGDCGPAVFDYLMHVDLKGFNPNAAAFKTRARERMITDVQSDLASWVRTLLRSPDSMLRLGDMPLVKDLWTSKELLALYDPLGKTGTTANGVARELRRAGATACCHGVQIRLQDGTLSRVYAIRNAAKWKEAGALECLKHIVEAGSEKKPKF